MLKKLRLKFILINMSIVTIMLGVIFGLLYVSTSRNLERESIQMMQSLAINPIQMMPPSPGGPMADVRLPYFSVHFNHTGEIISIGGGFFDLSNEKYLQEVVNAAQESPLQTGVIKDYHLRYFRSETPMGKSILFADMTSEQATLRGLVKTSAMIGILAFLAFLAISILLSHWAVKPVEKAWQKQKQFVADASHELKTPLTVIMTDAELLHAPDCPETDREPLSGSILTMTSQMRGLVENLLDLARIDNGSVKEEFCNVSFSEIGSEAIMLFEPVFFEKGLPLHYEIEPDIQLCGIPSHLKQLVGILLDNAGKYASPGGEAVVRLTKSAQKKCLLEVSNQGEPINTDDMTHLFERFYRADKARTMNHSYGLGLSIAQSIAEEHHGKIWAVSEDGYNRFYVEIPRQN